jgi:preprotein translocase subunit SecG
MGRNEIRLRRQMMSAGKIQGYRNYSALMQEHQRGLKTKRVMRVFIYFLIIAFFLIVLFMVFRWEKKQTTPKQQNRVTSSLKHSSLKEIHKL